MSVLHDVHNLLTLAKFIIYILFRIIRSLILLESDVIGLIKKLNKQYVGKDVEFFHILARYRLDKTDICRDTDFLIFNDSFGEFEEICDARWHIYAITDYYVYFCQVPFTDVSIITHTKLSSSLYEKAERMARMNLHTFTARANNLSPLKCKSIVMHSTPACGATVTGKLLQSADPTAKSFIVMGEPPMLSSIAILMHSISIEGLREITKAAIRYSLNHYEKSQTVLIKARSCCGKVVPYIHYSNPSIQHIFVTSKNPTEGIPRLIQNSSVSIPTFSILPIILKNSFSLCDFFTCWRLLERDTVTKIGPQNDMEFTLAQIMGATVNYQRNLKYYALDTIYFEDLMLDTASVLRPILYLCGLSEFVIPECIEWKRKEDTVLKKLWETPTALDDDQKLRIKMLVELLQQEWNH